MRAWNQTINPARMTRNMLSVLVLLLFGLLGLAGRETAQGAAFMVRDIDDGTGENPGSALYPYGAIGRTVFFKCFDDVHGLELWKSDGTVEGTMLLKDINPGRRNMTTAEGDISRSRASPAQP